MSTDYEVVTDRLQFPEGPVAMPDGSVLVVEIERGTLSRVQSNGSIDVVAHLGGGPNGAAIGPEGFCYVCNNGGFEWTHARGRTYPTVQSNDYSTGRIERVNLDTGEFETLYENCNGVPLKGPNDIVFDKTGGFWFTDHGKTRMRERDRTGVFYAQPDGSAIEEVIFPLEAPNGVGLSPNEDVLYVAETPTARLWAYPLSEPGKLRGERLDRPDGGRVVPGRNTYCMFDSLAVDAEGNVCVATLMNGGITVLSPNGDIPRFVPMPDRLTTNICFGGHELKTAYITLSSTGQLVKMPWEPAGLPLNFLNK